LAVAAVIGTETIEFEPGDGIVFDSHLVHASTDNTSDQVRVAAVAHFAAAGTADRTTEVFGVNPFNDWVPFLRGATVVVRTREGSSVMTSSASRPDRARP